MNRPLNMIKLVNNLPSRPRGKACIVLTHDYKGQREWAMELARQTDSDHIDLLVLQRHLIVDNQNQMVYGGTHKGA